MFMELDSDFGSQKHCFSYKTMMELKMFRLRSSLDTKTVKLNKHKKPTGKFSKAKILDRAKSFKPLVGARELQEFVNFHHQRYASATTVVLLLKPPSVIPRTDFWKTRFQKL